MFSEPTSTLPFTSTPQNPEQADAPLPGDLGHVSQEVGELVGFLHLIDGLPTEYRADLYKALDRLVDSFERRQRILSYIQESLGQMNIDLKYLIFDLEATRRERDEYRKRLEFLT